jgi:hypothetical protein
MATGSLHLAAGPSTNGSNGAGSSSNHYGLRLPPSACGGSNGSGSSTVERQLLVPSSPKPPLSGGHGQVNTAVSGWLVGWLVGCRTPRRMACSTLRSHSPLAW